MSKKHTQPKAYTAPHDVYTSGVYHKAGDPFVTDAPKGKEWEEKTPAEAHTIQAAVDPFPSDPPLEALSFEALQAVAVTKNVNTTDMDKKQLIDAIKAADDPTR